MDTRSRTGVPTGTDEPSGARASPEAILAAMLEAQCRAAPAEAGAFLRWTEGGGAEAVAVFPALTGAAPDWLTSALEAAKERPATTASSTHALDGGQGMYESRMLVLVPVAGAGGVAVAAGAYVVRGAAAQAGAIRARLELFRAMLENLELRAALVQRGGAAGRLAEVIDAAVSVGEQASFRGAAMALCNELAARFAADRVSVGFVGGNRVVLAAMSHTEKFSRKLLLVQRLESVMEECADQDDQVLVPEAGGDVVRREAEEFSREQGSICIASLPLRRGADVRGVATLERPGDRPLARSEVESLRLVLDAVFPHLCQLHETDRWFGARLVRDARGGLAWALSPRRTWLKAGAIVGAAFVLFAFLVPGTYRVDGSFTVEATTRRAVAAPFEGFLRSVEVKIGQEVKGGETVLARLDASELRLEAAGLEADRDGALKRASQARDEGRMAEAQVAEAEARRDEARLDLVRSRIERAELTSPISGVVVSGDLERVVGAPVKTGDVLFEVAPLDAMYADVAVPEEQIADVRVGQEGKLATASYPGRRIAFSVQRVDPAAKLVQERNVFNVRVELQERPEWLRPGMEGVARIEAGERAYAWIWTRRLVNWVRMKLWI